MKIYISNYRDHWISPYTIVEKIYFWKEIDICNLTPFQERLANVVEPFSKGLKFVLDKIHPRVEYVKIDRWDTWSMDTTLAQIIHPMLVQLKKEKHGVPGHFAHMKNPRTGKEISWQKAERLWNQELDKMIFAFGEICKDDYESQFYTRGPEGDPLPWEDGHVGGTWDMKKLKAHNEKIQEGLESFGRHYRNLWD